MEKAAVSRSYNAALTLLPLAFLRFLLLLIAFIILSAWSRYQVIGASDHGGHSRATFLLSLGFLQ